MVYRVMTCPLNLQTVRSLLYWSPVSVTTLITGVPTTNSKQSQSNLPPPVNKVNVYVLCRSESPLAKLYTTSTMEHHHLDHCTMILNSEVNLISQHVIFNWS